MSDSDVDSADQFPSFGTGQVEIVPDLRTRVERRLRIGRVELNRALPITVDEGHSASLNEAHKVFVLHCLTLLHTRVYVPVEQVRLDLKQAFSSSLDGTC